MNDNKQKIPLKEWLLHPRTVQAQRKALRFYYGLLGIWTVLLLAWGLMNFTAPAEQRSTIDLGINAFAWFVFLMLTLQKRNKLKADDNTPNE